MVPKRGCLFVDLDLGEAELLALKRSCSLGNQFGLKDTGHDPVTAIRLSTEFRSAIDAWRNTQPIEPSRSAAIIYLASVGLRALASGFEPKQERKEK